MHVFAVNINKFQNDFKSRKLWKALLVELEDGVGKQQVQDTCVIRSRWYVISRIAFSTSWHGEWSSSLKLSPKGYVGGGEGKWCGYSVLCVGKPLIFPVTAKSDCVQSSSQDSVGKTGLLFSVLESACCHLEVFFTYRSQSQVLSKSSTGSDPPSPWTNRRLWLPSL